jgi:hypothetical protein
MSQYVLLNLFLYKIYPYAIKSMYHLFYEFILFEVTIP